MNKPAASDAHSPEIMAALGVFGKMLSIASVYGMNHPSVERPLKEAHRALAEILNAEKQISLGLFNQTLTVNDKMITEYTVHLRALERRLVSLNSPHLVFKNGLTLEELGKLVGALCQTGTPTETVKERLDAAGLTNIKANNVEYVAQHEGERLVGESEGAGGAGKNGAGKGAGDKDGGKAAPTIQIDQVVAFLKGAPTASGEPPSEELQQMLSDPEQLAQLIMDSVNVRQSMQSIDGGESLADVVIGCLRRTYSDLSEQKKFKSPTGKASLHKAMLLLEQTVVDKIREAVGEDQPEIDAQILNALQDAEEQRQIEILAARYAEQHKKISKVEMDIRRYAEEHGEDKARQILDAANVPEQDWSQLKAEPENKPQPALGDGGGKNDGSGGAGGGGAPALENLNMGALAIVLDKIDTIMHLDDAPPEIVQDAIQQVRETVQETTGKFGEHIETLESRVEQLETADKQSPATRQKRADLLMEISQLALKLAQPLTVISASIEAAMDMNQKAFQQDLLSMAHEAAESMKELMARLTRLVGYPSMKEADANRSLYE